MEWKVTVGYEYMKLPRKDDHSIRMVVRVTVILIQRLLASLNVSVCMIKGPYETMEKFKPAHNCMMKKEMSSEYRDNEDVKQIDQYFKD